MCVCVCVNTRQQGHEVDKARDNELPQRRTVSAIGTLQAVTGLSHMQYRELPQRRHRVGEPRRQARKDVLLHQRGCEVLGKGVHVLQEP